MEDDIKTDPATCRHDVVQAWVGHAQLRLWVLCISCEKDLSDPKLRASKNYVYNKQHNLWVNTKKGGS